MSFPSQPADPLDTRPSAARPAYATGMLLDARDFSDEQTYHRGRLARALAGLAGDGCVAGLGIAYLAAGTSQPECIQVNPGLALDRLGRLLEVRRPACIRLANWFAGLDAGTLIQASYGNLARFVSPRLADNTAPLPARALVADVYAAFATCPVGLAPSFAGGPFDALDAVATARICDAYQLSLIPRTGLDDGYSGLPLPLGAAPVGDASAAAGARRDALQDAILNAYDGGSGGLGPAPEQPPGVDPGAVFLGRVFLPVDTGSPPARLGDPVLVDNWGRRFLPPQTLLAQWLGL